MFLYVVNGTKPMGVMVDGFVYHGKGSDHVTFLFRVLFALEVVVQEGSFELTTASANPRIQIPS